MPFPSPGDLPNPRIEPGYPALQADSLPSEPPGKPRGWVHRADLGFGIYLSDLQASLVAQMVKRLPTMWETQVRSLGWEDPWRRKWQPIPVFLPGKSMDREAWWATVHRVAKSQT